MEQERWIELISERVGNKVGANDEQKIQFALALELSIPQMITYSELAKPDRQKIIDLDHKLDRLLEILANIEKEIEKSEYLENISKWAFAYRRYPEMDIKDIYYFFDAMSGFLEDQRKSFKTGHNNSLSIIICKHICGLYHRLLNKEPGCYEQNRLNVSNDVMDCTPYERVCYAVNDRYSLNLTWSSMRTAAKIYKSEIQGR